ncbi:non-ribosomal peptide synthetase [Nocardia terpenica]|uniref:Non-ribosomal peptide synthetase n=1 Tax=Nocardia terpenica TaxID=455432 RepID=A0A6G9Z4J8_9NOCA|nr:non-ribosomal peptide synthetase [Nocardia terpenica]QIS20394.1 non-ribosomal peptide synthetase [Nocardia terpenica]
MTSHISITAGYLARFQRVAERGDPARVLPVTGAQRRFLLARRLAPGGLPDLAPLFFAFPRGTIDAERLACAARHLAATHPALRARPTVLRGTPVLHLVDDSAIPVIRVLPRPEESADDALRRALAGWEIDGPPLRLFLADDTANDTEILAIVLDHAACDEQSLGRILGDLTVAYRDDLTGEDTTASSVAEYREAVNTQLAVEERASDARAIGYWTRRLTGVGAPADTPRGDDRTVGFAQRRLPIADGGRATAFPVVLASCSAAARAVHGPDTVPMLGYPWGGRPATAPPVLGCFLNTVVHPAHTVDPEATAEVWWDDLDHADTPFDEVARAARSAGTPWTGALDALLTFEDLTHRPPLELGGVTGREIHIDGRPIQAPFVVSVSYGTELLVRMAWDRGVVADGPAHDAFAELLAGLRSNTHPTAQPG